MSKTYRTKDGAFEYGYVRRPSDMYGTMLPTFRPHWWAQLLSNGAQEIFSTKQEMWEWINSWYEPQPSRADSYTFIGPDGIEYDANRNPVRR